MMPDIERVLNQHFNGKPSELLYGCNKVMRPNPAYLPKGKTRREPVHRKD